MGELYYVFGMWSGKRAEAKVFTATEAKKVKNAVLCGATFYQKQHEYGLLYCLPDDFAHWNEWAKANKGKMIEWQEGKLRAPNGSEIARKALTAANG